MPGPLTVGPLLSVPYRIITATEGPEEMNVGVDDSRGTVIVKVAWHDVYQANLDLLGYPSVDTINKRLRRNLPATYPNAQYRWWVCTKVSVKSFLPGKNTVNLGKDGAEFGFSFGTKLNDKDYGYSFAYLNCIFEPVRYTRLTDFDPRLANPDYAGEWDESRRFVTRPQVPGGRTLQIEKGSFKYAEADAGFPGFAVKSTFSGQISRTIPQTELHYKWWYVPGEWILKPTTGIADYLEAANGCVNNRTWNGFNPGELLFLAPKITEVEGPFSPTILGRNIQTDSSLMYNVEIPVIRFNPPAKGVAVPAGFGHQLVPAPQLVTPIWYLATSDGTATGNRIYPGINPYNIFRSPGLQTLL